MLQIELKPQNIFLDGGNSLLAKENCPFTNLSFYSQISFTLQFASRATSATATLISHCHITLEKFLWRGN